jgi:hypothetical protein
MNEELTRFVRARIDEDDAEARNGTEPGAVRLGREVEANRTLLNAYEAAAASSPAYQVATALELAVAQRAAVWRDHPAYRDWADEDPAPSRPARTVPRPGPARSRVRPRGRDAALKVLDRILGR